MKGKILNDNELKEVAKSNIVEVIEHYISLNSKHKVCCPFHEEKTPSFQVYPNKGFYKCYGCGAWGDAIEFVKKYNKLNYPEALEKLGEILNFSLQYGEAREKGSFVDFIDYVHKRVAIRHKGYATLKLDNDMDVALVPQQPIRHLGKILLSKIKRLNVPIKITPSDFKDREILINYISSMVINGIEVIVDDIEAIEYLISIGAGNTVKYRVSPIMRDAYFI